MKSKSTVLWFVLAVTLAAAIWILGNYFQPAATGAKPLMAGLQADQVTDLQIIPAGARKISVTRTNKTWLLEEPVAYPAQAAAVEGLLDALEKLTPVTSFSAGELNSHKNADAEFGFDNPQFTVDVATSDQTWHLRVGNKTAPGDGVYVRVVGGAEAYMTDTAWLQFLPHDATAWRDTTLADIPDELDWLIITNGAQVIELRRDMTNRLWRIIRPTPPARADNLRIVTAIEQLRTAKASSFVTDDPKADLTAYGLQPAALDVWLGSGTNLMSAIHAGKEVSGQAGEVFARREGWTTVVTTPKEALKPWRGTWTDFRDPNLLEFDPGVSIAAIDVRGSATDTFTLQRQGSNMWAEAGQKFPVDTSLIAAFVQTLASLRILNFVSDVNTAAGLQNYGLANPSLLVTLRSVASDTNSVIAQLLFGTETNMLFGTETKNIIYVKRGDENFVYAVDPSWGKFLYGDYYRDPHVWNFSETNVAQLTVRANGKTQQMYRNGTRDWTLVAGQGMIIPAAVEEAVHQLGQLSVAGWLGRKFVDDARITTNSPSITIELKSTGEKHTVDIGREWNNTAVGVVTLDGERWVFAFPPMLYQVVHEGIILPDIQ